MELVGTAEGTLLLKIAIRCGAKPFTPADEDAIVLSNLAEKGFVIEVDVDTYCMTLAGAQAVFELKEKLS